MPNHIICVKTTQSNQNNIGACQGDLGGPLVVTTDVPDTINGTVNYLIGINSWARPCGGERPFGAMNVNRFLEFIKQEMAGTQPELCSRELSAKSCIECSEY